MGKRVAGLAHTPRGQGRGSSSVHRKTPIAAGNWDGRSWHATGEHGHCGSTRRLADDEVIDAK